MTPSTCSDALTFGRESQRASHDEHIGSDFGLCAVGSARYAPQPHWHLPAGARPAAATAASRSTISWAACGSQAAIRSNSPGSAKAPHRHSPDMPNSPEIGLSGTPCRPRYSSRSRLVQLTSGEIQTVDPSRSISGTPDRRADSAQRAAFALASAWRIPSSLNHLAGTPQP